MVTPEVCAFYSEWLVKYGMLSFGISRRSHPEMRLSPADCGTRNTGLARAQDIYKRASAARSH